MKVFLTGSTGFVGKQLLKDLMENRHKVKCLVRKGSEHKLEKYINTIEIEYGDITNIHCLENIIKGCDAVINIVGIIREIRGNKITFERLHYEGTRNLAVEAKKQGVSRFIQMSSLGANKEGKTQYQQTKYRAEDFIRNSGLDYTIFRPSIIFGKEDNFVNIFANMLKIQQFIPVIGDGKYKMQPVAVENVSAAFVNSLERKDTIGKLFEVGGPEKIEFNEIINIIGKVLCLPPYKICVPAWIMSNLAEMFDWIPVFPVTKDQITMLLEGNTCNEKPFFDHFKIPPVFFEEGIAKYLS
ncbi:MAG: complex I NDUFA9 subunit family protein [Planctomycetes bacterium]|nr:complex I NDUFA9 subunit family protein [Planctomycetota bacterium]